jgi:hypothetical protein
MLGPLPQVSLVRPPDVAAMAAVVSERAAAAADGREADAEPPAEYERTRCVAQIAEVLDGVTAGYDAGAPRRSVTRSR